MNLNKRLFDLLTENHRTQKELADAISVPERTVSSWKARGSEPPAGCVMSISKFFGISAECFLTGEEHTATNVINGNVASGTVVQGANSSRITIKENHSLTDEEMELLRLFHSLDVKRRVKLLDFGFTLEEELNSKN